MMNGNNNNTQRVGDNFIAEIEDIISQIKENQGVVVSVRQITNLLTRHDSFKEIKKDTVDFNFKEVKEKWQF